VLAAGAATNVTYIVRIPPKIHTAMVPFACGSYPHECAVTDVTGWVQLAIQGFSGSVLNLDTGGACYRKRYNLKQHFQFHVLALTY
jgi:hypothetical protein